GAEPAADEPEHCHRRGQVAGDEEPAECDQCGEWREESGARRGDFFALHSPLSTLFSSHTDSTGTKVLESRYDEIIAKPTASDSGTNSARADPCMKNDGMNTASTHSIANRRGTAVSALPRRTASAIECVRSICVWMFSTSTVGSSTRMPTASASPPSVMRLSVWPVSQSETTAPRSASGIFRTTTKTLRQSRRNRSTIKPV